MAGLRGMKRVLVTGATGCIGHHALPELLKRGWEVHAVSSRPIAPQQDDVVWHQADLLDARQVRQVTEQVQASHLLHLAWFIAPGQWAHATENFAWVQASLELLRAFRNCGGARVATSGSCLEYDWRYGYCSEDRTPCLPHTTYGTCKHALQLLTSAFAASDRFTSAWGRVFFVYGPLEHPQRLVAHVVQALLAGEPARCSHGRQIRDYLFAQDVANALVTLLESDVSGPVNIASGEPVSLKEIVTRIGALIGRPELIQLGAIPPAPTDAPIVVADVTRLSQRLSWQPRFTLDDGLMRTIEWWRERAIQS